MLNKYMVHNITPLFQTHKIADTENMTVRKGVYCDLTKTLLIPQNADFVVNEGIRRYLREKKRQGINVYLVSKIPNNPNAFITGVTEEFGPVFGKASFKDCILEELIDDNPDYLHAQRWIDPGTPEAKKFFAQFTQNAPDHTP
jgi:hypothetical protein